MKSKIVHQDAYISPIDRSLYSYILKKKRIVKILFLVNNLYLYAILSKYFLFTNLLLYFK